MGLGLRPAELGTPWMQCDYRVCDVRDGDLLRRLVLEFQPGYVFHLAAQSSVKQSWEHWELTTTSA